MSWCRHWSCLRWGKLSCAQVSPEPILQRHRLNCGLHPTYYHWSASSQLSAFIPGLCEKCQAWTQLPSRTFDWCFLSRPPPPLASHSLQRCPSICPSGKNSEYQMWFLTFGGDPNTTWCWNWGCCVYLLAFFLGEAKDACILSACFYYYLLESPAIIFVCVCVCDH